MVLFKRADRGRRLILIALTGSLIVLPAACGSPKARVDRAGEVWGSPTISTPASMVNVFSGTGKGDVTAGNVGEYPGANLPFGMMQWSPDTSPNRVEASGYTWTDSMISGFSLTHLSGAGCPAEGDVPILPVSGPIGSDPRGDTESFSHKHEAAGPGRYEVTLGTKATHMELAVTTRTGISKIKFPSKATDSVLFKTTDSENGTFAANVTIVGDDEVTGEVSSGKMCTTRSDYTLYFAAVFNRPFQKSGTWGNGGISATSGSSKTCEGKTCGAFVTFTSTSSKAPSTVMMKVGISYVNRTGALSNIAAEDPGWTLTKVERSATGRWNSLLSKISVQGKTFAEERTFYTALYHSLLFPSIESDADGKYRGEDQLVHTVKEGGESQQFANFSEWDIYRSEFQLISLLDPLEAGQMVQSLINDAASTGFLPRWATVSGDAAQMDGDSADPIIADAYAFGIRNFTAKAALADMEKGATVTQPIRGLEQERQYLPEYLKDHYIASTKVDITSYPNTAGSSMTLEYGIDDFSIGMLANDLGDSAVESKMMARAHNWEYLFNPATGYIQGKMATGAFPPGPVYNPALKEPGGEEGFEEGNAVQYTFDVPQDLEGLSELMGGNLAVDQKLDTLFLTLNAGRYSPHDWAGNEPSFWAPYEYDWFAEPYKTESVVRNIITKEYNDGPDNEPGNDDLGAMSSFYVWSAIGLFPEIPGTANLAIGSPLFQSVSIKLSSGKSIVIHGPNASTNTPYIHKLTVSHLASNPIYTVRCGVRTTLSVPSSATNKAVPEGSSWTKPWVSSNILNTGGTLTFTLSSQPNRSWGSATKDSPPSYAMGNVPDLSYSMPSGQVTAQKGTPTSLTIGAKDFSYAQKNVIDWSAVATPGITLSKTSGTLLANSLLGTAFAKTYEKPLTHTPPSCTVPKPATQALSLTSSVVGEGSIVFTMDTTTGKALPPVVVKVNVKT